MKLTPRYGDEPVIRLEVPIDPGPPMLRQRARLAANLASLDDEQWAMPSRCAAWSVRDVIAHLTDTNQFWAYSIRCGLQGEPTRFLADFDPVASPLALVEAAGDRTPGETLDRFVKTNDDLAAAITDLDDASWSVLAEAPPGHLGLRLVVLHALWDSWIHERDVALPLGLDTVEEADEITGSLTYAVALGPAFLASTGSTRVGTIDVRASRPDVHVVIDLGTDVVIHDGPCADGAVAICGDAVALTEALSFRAPFESPIAEEDDWVVNGLAEAFDIA